MVQTSISVQTKVLIVSAAALATGLAAYALGYYDYDWRLWQQGEPKQMQQQDMGQQQLAQQPTQDGPTRDAISPTVTSDLRLPDAVVGKPYETRITASTGANTRWSLEQGALPSGLSLDEARGVINGTPTVPGLSLFRLKFGNNDLTSVSQFTLNVVTGEGVTVAATPQVSQVQITTTALPEGRVDQAYGFMMQASGDDLLARQWVIRGDAPPGISISADGKLMGTPTKAGTFLVSIALMGKTNDEARQAVEVVKQYSLVIGMADPVPTDPPLKITSATTLPSGRVGVEYQQQLVATGGPSNARYVWQNLNGVPGLTGTSEGMLKGTPTAAGTYNLRLVTVTLQDTAGVSASTDFQIQILPREEGTSGNSGSGSTSLMITGGYPDGTIGNYYSSRVLDVSGGQPPYEWSLAAGNIPSGFYMTSNSQISGYANQYGIFTFTVQVRDQAGRTARAERTIHIRPSQPVVSASVDPDLSNRLHRIELIGVQIHDLIKLQDDGNPDTQFDTTVYYIGADGRRHSFPNPKVYFSWFPDFSRVRIVASRELADIPLGANLTYRPGTRLVKFATDPRVYAVDADRRLRWVKTEAVAVALYGPFWARQVDDVSDAFYMDYRFGQDVDRSEDYSAASALRTAVYPSDVLPR